MRVVLIASAPPAALGFAEVLAAMGHEVPAVVAIRAPAGRYGPGYPGPGDRAPHRRRPAGAGLQRFAELSARLLAEALARVAAGDPGDPQDEAQASYAGVFEPEYVEVDWSRPAREVHDQTRAWTMSPPVGGRRGPLTELDGRTVRLVRTSLDGRRGGRPVACGDGMLWVLASEPAPARA